MKFVAVGPTYPYRGGIAYFNTLLCQSLSIDHEVVLCSFKTQYPSFLYGGRSDKDPSACAPRVDCRYVLSAINPLTWWQCYSAIEEESPDAVIFHWWVPFWSLAFGSVATLVSRRLNIPIIFLCHNVLPHERFPCGRLLTRFAFHSVDAFIVQSKRDMEDLRSFKPRSPAIRTHHPSYAPLVARRWATEEARSSLDLAGPILLYFGFVRPYKGLAYLLRALPLVRRKIPAHLLVVGEFWDDKEKYTQLIDDLGIEDAVTIVDRYVPNEELGRYFDAADAVVLPYVDATQSGVIQLAYGFGKPVISTRVGGVPEVVVDGETGYLVPPRDPQALARGILRFYEPTPVDWRANIERMQERFAWAHLVEAITDLIKQVPS